ncbi:hypothetical protein B0G69_2198 [Paraburkholderia sp. RAU2J]|nr:hypothetical protein B0G69_2198 [Paraburkholderia sp. RAU2J]
MDHGSHDDCPYFLHSSLRLHAMVHKPLNAPAMPARETYCSHMQMLCQRADGERLICTYLSPLDAVMGSRGLSGDDHFWPIDLRCVDTRQFIEQNGGLSISVNYAYAADRKRLLVDRHGHPMMVYTGDTFEVPEDQRDHFSIRFSERVPERIMDVYLRAGLSNFAETLAEMDHWSAAQIADAQDQALARMPKTVHVDDVGKTSMDQCAVYDPESGEWTFVDI